MERLTNKHYRADDYYMVCSGTCSHLETGCDGCRNLEEIINKLGAYEDTGLSPDDVMDLMGSHAMAIAELAKVPDWIPVTEKLPAEWTEYLVMIEGAKKPTTLYYDPRRDMWYEPDDGVYRVSHWVPMPGGPRKEAGA